MGHVTAYIDQLSFRFYANDSQTESGSTGLAAADTSITHDTQERFRLRFLLAETAGGKETGFTPELYYRVNGGTWAPCARNSFPVVEDVFTTYSNTVGSYYGAQPTTQRLGTGTFVAGEIVEVSTAYNGVTLENSETEYEWIVAISRANTTDGDTVDFEIRRSDGTVLEGYTSGTASVTVNHDVRYQGYTNDFENADTTDCFRVWLSEAPYYQIVTGESKTGQTYALEGPADYGNLVSTYEDFPGQSVYMDADWKYTATTAPTTAERHIIGYVWLRETSTNNIVGARLEAIFQTDGTVNLGTSNEAGTQWVLTTVDLSADTYYKVGIYVDTSTDEIKIYLDDTEYDSGLTGLPSHNIGYITWCNNAWPSVPQATPIFYFDRTYFSETAPSGDLTADQQTYTLTGVAASTEYNRTMDAATASFTLTGIAAALEFNAAVLEMIADTQSYTLTGVAAELDRNLSLAADVQTYTLTGVDAGTIADRILAADTQSYILTGIDASLEHARVVGADQQTYTLTGVAAGLTADRTLTADQQTYTLTGVAADIDKAYNLAADQQTYTLTGVDATFQRSLVLDGMQSWIATFRSRRISKPTPSQV